MGIEEKSNGCPRPASISKLSIATNRNIPEKAKAILFLKLRGDPFGLADLRLIEAIIICTIPISENNIARGQVVKATTIAVPDPRKRLLAGRASLNSVIRNDTRTIKIARLRLNSPT
jgi:hypothetical protein